jgi:hypothetical protein
MQKIIYEDDNFLQYGKNSKLFAGENVISQPNFDANGYE